MVVLGRLKFVMSEVLLYMGGYPDTKRADVFSCKKVSPTASERIGTSLNRFKASYLRVKARIAHKKLPPP